MFADEESCSVVGVVLVGVVFGTGIAVVPSAPVEVLKVYEGVVVSAPGVGAGVPTVVPGESGVVPGICATAVVSSGVTLVTEASDSIEDAALESTDEYSEASEFETSGLVAVATMLEN